MAMPNRKLLRSSIAGAIIFVIGLLLAFVGFPLIVDDQIHRQVKLENGTDAFERWRELPVGLDFKIYLFDVENPHEVTFEGAYPKVVERGPYVYKQYRRKTNIEYDDFEDSLTYTSYTHFEYDQEASGEATENDEVVILNAPLNAIFHVASRFLPGPLMKLLVDSSWTAMFPGALDKSMFFKGRVGDILFDGYSFCHPRDWTGTAGLMCMFATFLDIPFLQLEDDFSLTFAFFRFKQDQHDGIYTVNAGNKDVTKIGQISQWNGYAYNTIWGDRMSHCNKIKGTDGTIYAPNIQKDYDTPIYTTEVCRTVYAGYIGDEVVNGVTAQKRTLLKSTLADPEKDPNNQCYCNRFERNLYGEKKCLPDGFLDLSPCYLAPLVASWPHFLDSDEEYAKTVEGLSPDREKHETVIFLEGMSGIPLQASIRLQFNMILRPINGITVTQSVTPSVVPVAWIEMGTVLPETLVGEFRSLLNLAVVGVEVVKWVIVAIGALMFLICGGVYMYQVKTRTK